MQISFWLRRSVPALLLLGIVACLGPILKPLQATQSLGRRTGRQPEETEAPATTGSMTDDWVRTRNGWEHEASWFATVGRYEPALHPTVVAAMMGLVSVWGFVAYPTGPQGAGQGMAAGGPTRTR